MSSAGLAVPFLMRSQWPESAEGAHSWRPPARRGGGKPLSGLLPPAERPYEQVTGVGGISVDICLQLLVYSYPIKIKVWWQ